MLIQLEQGSEEWLNFRKGKIGASQTAGILGMSPWRTPIETYEDILGLSKPQDPTPWMQRGNDREEEARAIYEKASSDCMTPILAEHDTHPYIIASLDGLSMDHSVILEIKWANKTVFEMAQNGEIPDYYKCQIIQQLACVPEAKRVDFMVCTNTDYAIVPFPRNEKEIEEQVAKVVQFYEEHIEPQVPPPLTKEDFLEITDDPDFAAAARNWLMCKQATDIAREEETEARKRLLDCTDDGSCLGYGVKIKKIYETRTDYKKACLDSEIDLSEYQKEQTVKWRITEMKDD